MKTLHGLVKKKQREQYYLLIFLPNKALRVAVHWHQRQRKVWGAVSHPVTQTGWTQPMKHSKIQHTGSTQWWLMSVYPLTCVSSPWPPCGSYSGCTEHDNSRNVFPVSRPSGLACVCAPTCSSTSGSQSALGFPLQESSQIQICRAPFQKHIVSKLLYRKLWR